jgi:hypothetical protein
LAGSNFAAQLNATHSVVLAGCASTQYKAVTKTPYDIEMSWGVFLFKATLTYSFEHLENPYQAVIGEAKSAFNQRFLRCFRCPGKPAATEAFGEIQALVPLCLSAFRANSVRLLQSFAKKSFT